MGESMKISYEIKPIKSDINKVYHGLGGFNEPVFGNMVIEEFGCFLRDENQVILGGATGELVGKVALVEYVWVEEKLRGQGYGYKNFDVLENSIKDKNITEIHLDTYSFQAAGFYEKMGFKEVARYCMMREEKIDKIFLIKQLIL